VLIALKLFGGLQDEMYYYIEAYGGEIWDRYDALHNSWLFHVIEINMIIENAVSSSIDIDSVAILPPISIPIIPYMNKFTGKYPGVEMRPYIHLHFSPEPAFNTIRYYVSPISIEVMRSTFKSRSTYLDIKRENLSPMPTALV